jgi:hypothetical protein
VLWDNDPNHDVRNPDRTMNIRVFLNGTIATSFGGTVNYSAIVRDALGRPTTVSGTNSNIYPGSTKYAWKIEPGPRLNTIYVTGRAQAKAVVDPLGRDVIDYVDIEGLYECPVTGWRQLPDNAGECCVS